MCAFYRGGNATLRVMPGMFVTVTLPLVLPRLAAQTLGLPSTYHEVMSGFGAALDVGGDRFGFRTVGVTGIIALGHITADSGRLPLFDVGASAARVKGDGGEAGGSAVGLEVSLLGSFKVGIDRSTRGDIRRAQISLAAALPLFACASGKRIVELYGVPVWHFERVARPAGAAWQPSWGSGSVGAFFELRSGLGFQLAVDVPFRGPTPDPYHRVVVGLGMHYSRHGILESTTATEKGGCAFAL